jgi:hypothetical protein
VPAKAVGLGKESEQTLREKAEKTLLAIREFKRYLESVEKDLSYLSKKFSDKEIAQGVGFAATGIHEALTYLAIVKKVIEKTERIVAKRSIVSGDEADGRGEGLSDGRASLSSST